MHRNDEVSVGGRSSSPVCPNCGSEEVGRYCAACGQEQDDPRVSIGRWLREAADEVFSVNSKLPQTLHALILRPGKLTRAWIEGRRARYVSPLRLFLSALVLFFAVFFALDLDRPTGEAAGVEARGVTELVSGSYGPTPEQVAARQTVRNVTYAAVFLVVPFVALLLKLLHLRSNRYLVEHVVFALHLSSFSLLIILVGWGLDIAGDDLSGTAAFLVDDIISNVFVVWLIVYTALALRRTYGLGWGGTTLQTVALFGLLLGTTAVAARPVGYMFGRVLGRGGPAQAAENQAYDLLRQTRTAREEGDSLRLELLLPAAITAFYRIPDSEVDRHNRYHLIELQLWAGRPHAALATAERMLERIPEDAPALGMAGRAALEVGNGSLAADYYGRYLIKHQGDGRDSLIAAYGHEGDLDAFAGEAAGVSGSESDG